MTSFVSLLFSHQSQESWDEQWHIHLSCACRAAAWMRLFPCSVTAHLGGSVSAFWRRGARKTASVRAWHQSVQQVCPSYFSLMFSYLTSSCLNVTIWSHLPFAPLIGLIQPWRPITDFSNLIVLWELNHLAAPGTDHSIYSWWHSIYPLWLSNASEHSETSSQIWSQSHTPSHNRQMEAGTSVSSLE